ncbi:alginate lyase family protein [Salipiger pacificus]|nr:alginate lyase family protein [Alloyangia pacifica]MCA0948254.1 alginate lyase family protein [Alloyangia pacifica]
MRRISLLPTVPLLFLCAVPALAEGCPGAPEPVVTLDYGSRYAEDDPSRSSIDRESNAAVNRALRPIDAFIRDLVAQSNAVLSEGEDSAQQADCVLSRIAAWAEADALSDLGSFTARLSVGARLAGIAESYRQVRPLATDLKAAAGIEDWLTRRSAEQIDFWEKEATSGARTGNLRAWAALAVLLTGEVTGNDMQIGWASASAVRILCTARPDGSLPQETKRGGYGLHYQFHAIAPLVTIAAHLDRLGQPITESCDAALERAVGYALSDYTAKGALTEAYSGKPQSYFDGTETLQPHELAWLVAYRALFPQSDIASPLPRNEPLVNSKLGGDQRLLWKNGGQGELP